MADSRELWWVCRFCGNPEPAEAPYALGDSEPCSECGEGTAVVLWKGDARNLANALESGAQKRVRSYPS